MWRNRGGHSTRFNGNVMRQQLVIVVLQKRAMAMGQPADSQTRARVWRPVLLRRHLVERVQHVMSPPRSSAVLQAPRLPPTIDTLSPTRECVCVYSVAAVQPLWACFVRENLVYIAESAVFLLEEEAAELTGTTNRIPP
ncbi:hypothetical protein Q1695_008986 [Nippostrongylus brasiliensis]|nr:hypothetical protein Q1695_008986 [Nippostrongylus brasiliensis]